MKKITLLLVLFSTILSFAQSDDATVKTIYSKSLTNGKAYVWLDHLSNQIGGRLSGSSNADKAVQYTKS